jgi:hypothetical protein
MTALTTAFIFAAVLCFLAAVFSGLRGKKTACSETGTVENKAVIESAMDT